MRGLSKGLYNCLRLWIGDHIQETHHRSLQERVLLATAELHQKIACSSYEYRIDMPKAPDLVRGHLPHQSKLSGWTLKDVVKWRPVYEEISGVLICLSPGILRIGEPGEDPIPAAQPVVLVYDHLSPPWPSQQPLQAHPGYQQNQSVYQSPQQSPHATPHRSPRRSPERRSHHDPPGPSRMATGSRSSTLPEDAGASSRPTQDRKNSAPVSGGFRYSFFGAMGALTNIGFSEKRALLKDDGPRPTTRSQTPPSVSHSKPVGASQGAEKGAKKPKPRRHSMAVEPGSPPKSLSKSSTGEGLPP